MGRRVKAKGTGFRTCSYNTTDDRKVPSERLLFDRLKDIFYTDGGVNGTGNSALASGEGADLTVMVDRGAPWSMIVNYLPRRCGRL